MGKGLAFLNLKFFHPGNRDNQQRKWEALQREAAQKKRARERTEELRREQELKDYRLKILRKSGDSEDYDKELKRSEVSFLYDEPPGLKKALDAERKKIGEEQRMKEWQSAMEGMNREERRMAERQMEEGLSVHERNARRFDYLKHAPMQADYVKDMDVVHKPFGKVIKHVKCFKCGQWGHRVGDRLCPKSDHFTQGFYDSDPAMIKSAANTDDANADADCDGSRKSEMLSSNDGGFSASVKKEPRMTTTAAEISGRIKIMEAFEPAKAKDDHKLAVKSEVEEMEGGEYEWVEMEGDEEHTVKKGHSRVKLEDRSDYGRKRKFSRMNEESKVRKDEEDHSVQERKAGKDDTRAVFTSAMENEDPMNAKYYSKRRRIRVESMRKQRDESSDDGHRRGNGASDMSGYVKSLSTSEKKALLKKLEKQARKKHKKKKEKRKKHERKRPTKS